MKPTSKTRVVKTSRKTPAVKIDITVDSRRAKLVDSKLAAGLTREMAEATADRQLDRDQGIVRSPFADIDGDRESAIATEGANLNREHHNADSEPEVPVEVKLNVGKTAKA